MLVITNATVLKGAGRLKSVHIWIENGIICKLSETQPPISAQVQVEDVAGKFVSPGFIDAHVHLREPGFAHKETIWTGTRSAAKGGFTSIICMPNTCPAIDTPDTVQFILNKVNREGIVKVMLYGSITKGQQGRELTDFVALKQAGVIGFTDDGVGVQNAQMMKNAMAGAQAIGMPVVAHCEDESLVEGAVVTAGVFARRHGLKVIPNESEAIHVGRDILLAEATGVHYHVCHVSTEQSIRLIRQAKQRGVRVTAEVCPHHLLLSDEDIPGMDANWKMNPPLRTPRDVAACIEALEDGTIDIIVTDHAPHSEVEKAKGMNMAPFGIVGLETAFPLLYTKFVATGKWTLDLLVKRMTINPATLFGLPIGRLEVGAPADITVVDLETESEVDPNTFLSKGRNTPFTGWKLKGWPFMVLVNGQVVWRKDKGNEG